MKKEVFGDSDNNRSITNIQINKTRQDEENPNVSNEEFNDKKSYKRKNKRSMLKWVSVLVFLFVVLFIYSILFHSAEVKIEPRKETASLETIFTASNEKEEFIDYEVVSVKLSDSLNVQSTGKDEVKEVARGTITVSNTGGATKWVQKTRFETEDGILYRASNPVSVPKGTASDPGLVDVDVYADKPGEEFNIQSGLTFKVAGLKGTATYGNFSAFQKTPFTGGFDGVRKIASEADFNKAKNDLNLSLKNQLKVQLYEQYSDTKIILTENLLYKSNVFQVDSTDGENEVLVKADATLKAIVFPKTKLTDIIVAKILPESISDDDLIRIDNIDSLALKMVEENFDLESNEEFKFSVKGDAVFVWDIDENSFVTQILGKDLDDIEQSVLSERKDIKKVETDISPFWRDSVPKNKEDINIEIL